MLYALGDLVPIHLAVVFQNLENDGLKGAFQQFRGMHKSSIHKIVMYQTSRQPIGLQPIANFFGWLPEELHTCGSRHLLGVIYHAPDSPVLRIGDVQCAVRSLCEAGRAVFGAAGTCNGSLASKTIRKVLPIAGRLAVLHRDEHHFIALLFMPQTIPASVEGYKRAVAVLLGEHVSLVDKNVIRTPVPGERGQRLFKTLAAV